jgi:hypothetical protein
VFIGSLDGEAALARVVRGAAEVQEEEESDEEMEDEDGSSTHQFFLVK